MRNSRHADLKKMIQGLIIFTLLCWATQTLGAQWGCGDEVSIEKFVAPSRQSTVIELKTDAAISGNEIRLNQIARWRGTGEDVRVAAQDEEVVAVSEGNYKFDVEPRKQRNIGDIAWEITAISAAAKQKYTIYANVRAWQSQIIAIKPIVARQVISEADVSEKRILVDRLPEEGSLTIDQVVGQQSARDLSPGVAFTGRMVEAVQIAKVG